MQKGKYKTLIENILYFFICSIAVKIIGYLLLPIFTSNMSMEQYGVADILFSTVNLLYPIFMLGIGGAVLRFCMEKDNDNKLTVTVSFILLGFSTLCSIFTIPIICLFDKYEEYACFVPVLIFFTNALTIISSLCKAINKLKVVVIQNAIYSFLTLLLAIVLVKIYKLGVLGFMLTYCISNVLSLIYLVFKSEMVEYISNSYNLTSIKKEAKRILLYGIPLVPNSLAWWITQQSDRYMVTFWYGEAASIIATFVNTFIQAWQLSAVKEYEEEKSVEFYNNIYRIYSTLGVLITLFLLCTTKLFAKILYSMEFYIAWKYVPFLLICALLESQVSFFGTFYLANKNTKKYLYSSIIGALSNVLLNIILIPKLGINGASIATLIS